MDDVGNAAITVTDTLANVDDEEAATLKTAGADTVNATVANAAAIDIGTVITGIDALVLDRAETYTLTKDQFDISENSDSTAMNDAGNAAITIKVALGLVDDGEATVLKTAGADTVNAIVATAGQINSGTVITDIDALILTNAEDYTLTAAQNTIVVDADEVGMTNYTGTLTFTENADYGILAAIGSTTLILDTAIVTLDLGSSGVTTINLNGGVDHVVTAGTATETFVIGANNDGGISIASIDINDIIDLASETSTNWIISSGDTDGADTAVNAIGEWSFSSGTLTYWSEVNSGTEIMTLTGAASIVTTGSDMEFTIGS